jgi:fido (protein-threonine AMPylation protein)
LPKPWNDDPPGSAPQVYNNIASLLPQFQAEATTRPLPTIARAQGCHRAIYAGVHLPEPCYAGEVRDSDPNFPELYGYEVAVGGVRGTLSKDVPAELARLEQQIQTACGVLDAAVPLGRLPPDDQVLQSVLTACAIIHGEWIRIHPFANGNGRTARLWATWVGMRYGVPPFIEIKPRPGGTAYAAAASASMRGDHRLCLVVFDQMLKTKLGMP